MEYAIAVVGLYAGLNTLILLWIATATGQLRAKHKVQIGDGGVLHLTRILRGHANAMENVPMALILMFVMAGLQTPVFVLHGFGIVLTIGRLCHAMHFIKEDAPAWQRAVGATTSMLVLAVGALGVIGHAAVRLI